MECAGRPARHTRGKPVLSANGPSLLHRAQATTQRERGIADPEAEQIVHAAHALRERGAGEPGQIAFTLPKQRDAPG